MRKIKFRAWLSGKHEGLSFGRPHMEYGCALSENGNWLDIEGGWDIHGEYPDLCKKFVEMGLKSESELDFYWSFDASDPPQRILTGVGKWKEDDIPAFHPYDIIANTEQARKNAELLWGKRFYSDVCPFRHCNHYPRDSFYPIFEYHRHKVIDQPANKFWEYVKQTMKGK